MIAPFGLLLVAIALAPLFFAAWWGTHYTKVAFGLGGVTLAYYLVGLRAFSRVEETALEYFSFIVLIGALYVVSGGVHIRIKGEATPGENVVFLAFGAVAANLVGTTGASMLLIRPWLRMNKYRVTAYHVVFFIFIVSNVGGGLTPIGDPPLFLGYLQGVPFWWVMQHCWPMWITALGMLLLMFYVLDRNNYQRAPRSVRETLAEPPDEWHFEGLPNLFFLGVILVAVFIRHPPFLREILMLAAAAGSYWTTSKRVHHANGFNFHPIKEVAILFAGIFATMIPALDWLQLHAGQWGSPTASLYFWLCGACSSFLDNAPTYLSFLSAAIGSSLDAEAIVQVKRALEGGGLAALGPLEGARGEAIRQAYHALYQNGISLTASGMSPTELGAAFLVNHPPMNPLLASISVAAVFFGACTYIGNGPNFMVKAIAEQNKVAHLPGFLGYIYRYTLPLMVPMLIAIWLLFFR